MRPLPLLSRPSERDPIEEVLRWTLRQDLAQALEVLADGDAKIAADVLAGIECTDARERSSIFSAAAGVLSTYNSDAARQTAARPNFDPVRFAACTDTIYITSPEHHQAALAPLIVGLLEQIRHAVYKQARAGGAPEPGMLWLLDEAANIAPVHDLPALVSQAGGQSLQVVVGLQDLSQARTRWGHDVGHGGMLCEDHPVGQESISAEPVQRVREAVGKRLLSEGWTLLEQKLFDPPGVGTFALPLRDGFVATFVVAHDLLEDDSGALALAPIGLLGLDYEPARRITAALTGFARSGVVLKQPSLAVGLPDADEAAEAADSLVRFAAEQAPSLARLADVDTLIEMLRQRSAAPSSDPTAVLNGDEPMRPPPGCPEIPDPVPEFVAALLAGAGRHDEARRALAECKQPDPQDGDRENARFARQLTRWVQHGGGMALPKTPAQWPPDWPSRALGSQPPSSFGQFAAENMPEIQARQEAVRAVRAVSAGKSRDELRTLLRSELGSREVSMPPVAFEQTIDSLATEQEPFGKARLAFRGLRALWDIGHTGTPRVFSDRPSEPEDEPDPSWMKTPERAAYPIRLSGHDRVAVTLDPAAVPLLNDVMPKGAVQNRNIEVWFGLDNESPGGVSRLSVHIGSRRVGDLDAEATERFRPVLAAAAERGEDPWADAHLTRIPGATPCVLDVPLPEVSGP